MTHEIMIIPQKLTATQNFLSWIRDWNQPLSGSHEELMESCQRWLDKNFPGAVSKSLNNTWSIEFPSIEEKARFIIMYM